MRTCEFGNCGYPVFSTDKKTRIGYCKMHQRLRTDLDRRTSAQKIIAKIREGKSQVPKHRKEHSQQLKEWFAYHMANSRKECENCGRSLHSYNEKDWYGSQHHLLEKSLFPSVEGVLENHGVLGKWCCHHVWHSSWANASQMTFFPEAIKRIETFYHKVKEKSKINDIVLQEINPQLIN
jgi:hypothetical protein